MDTEPLVEPAAVAADRHQRTVVLGDDASSSADLAWLWINCHTWPGWRLEVVTAAPCTDFRVDAERVPLHPWEPANPRQPFAESQIAEVVSLRAEMDPRLALSRSTDLLVVGRRGPGLAKSLHLGSTAEWLMAHPPAPMLIARHGRPTVSAVVCADGSPHALVAAQSLASMPWIRGVTVTIASVDDGNVDVESAIGAVAALFDGTGAEVRRREARGAPTRELLIIIEDDDPDLVVLGTRGHTGLQRARVGSTAAAMAHSIDCSVLVACDDSVDEQIA